MSHVVILGVFVADTAYRADRMPVMGETVLGNSFSLGPGGKGSNQAVAAGRLGVKVSMISRLGKDDFGQMAIDTWKSSGVTPCISVMLWVMSSALTMIEGKRPVLETGCSVSSCSPLTVTLILQRFFFLLYTDEVIRTSCEVLTPYRVSLDSHSSTDI